MRYSAVLLACIIYCCNQLVLADDFDDDEKFIDYEELIHGNHGSVPVLISVSDDELDDTLKRDTIHDISPDSFTQTRFGSQICNLSPESVHSETLEEVWSNYHNGTKGLPAFKLFRQCEHSNPALFRIYKWHNRITECIKGAMGEAVEYPSQISYNKLLKKAITVVDKRRLGKSCEMFGQWLDSLPEILELFIANGKHRLIDRKLPIEVSPLRIWMDFFVNLRDINVQLFGIAKHIETVRESKVCQGSLLCALNQVERERGECSNSTYCKILRKKS